MLTKVETVDTVIKKAFKKVYLPYICYLDLFNHLDVSEPNIKRFTTGQDPNLRVKRKSVKDIEE